MTPRFIISFTGLFIFFLSLAFAPQAAAPCRAQDNRNDLTELSIEELININITSVSRNKKPLSSSPAAVYVLTSEDIRRSGVRSLPDLLRQVPGLHVGQINANTWAVTSRGFNGRAANKLQVLVDGRSVYTSLYSGVNWNTMDMMLSNIERIEIIRGPGASLWGSNAVNGVINIITKHSKETKGGLLTVGGGNKERFFSEARLGGSVSKDLTYRIHAKGSYRTELPDQKGGGGQDEWNDLRGGFRIDAQPGPDDELSLQGEIMSGRSGQELCLPFVSSMMSIDPSLDMGYFQTSLLGRWKHAFSDKSDFILQIYYGAQSIDWNYKILPYDFNLGLLEVSHTLDIDFQHRFTPTDGFVFTYGGELKYVFHHFNNNMPLFFNISPEIRSGLDSNFFVQAEFELIPERLLLTLGSKFELNHYTGFEYQPTARLAWTPNSRNTVWISASRAVRAPSRVDFDLKNMTRNLVPATPPLLNNISMITFRGSTDFHSEELIALEAGYRVLPLEAVSLDIALFYNIYSGLRSLRPLPQSTGPFWTNVPFILENSGSGDTYGIEISSKIDIFDWWRLMPNYSFFMSDFNRSPNPYTFVADLVGTDNPTHLFNLRSLMDLPWDLELDAGIRFVDIVPRHDDPAYIELDLRLGWRPSDHIEFSLSGRNLLHDVHSEYDEFLMFSGHNQIERSISGQFSLSF